MRKSITALIGMLLAFFFLTIISATTVDISIVPKLENVAYGIYDNADEQSQAEFNAKIDKKVCSTQTQQLLTYCSADKLSRVQTLCETTGNLPEYICDLSASGELEQTCEQTNRNQCETVGQIDYRKAYVELFLEDYPSTDSALIADLQSPGLSKAYEYQNMLFGKNYLLVRIGITILLFVALAIAHANGADFMHHLGGMFTRLGFIFIITNGVLFMYANVGTIDTTYILQNIGGLTIVETIQSILPLLAKEVVSMTAILVSAIILIIGLCLNIKVKHRPKYNYAQTPQTTQNVNYR